MKLFYHTRYRFYKPDQKEHKIFAISDIHFSDKTTKNLAQILKKAQASQPAIITISGDLVDNLDSINSHLERTRLIAWLTHLATIAPVCLCLGNHDFYRKTKDFKSALNRDHGYIAEKNEAFLNEIRSIDNVHLLDDSCYEDDDFYVFGLTLPPSYYEFDYSTEKHGNIFSPGNENLDILLQELDANSNFTTKLPKHKTKIALIHSPVHLQDDEAKEKLANFDFVLAGHMHNGVVPPLFNEVWRSRRGFLTPTKHVFKNHNTRLGLYGDNLIVLGAVTTVQKGAKPLGWLNSAFPIYYTTIETTRNETYARKPDIYKKYEKYL